MKMGWYHHPQPDQSRTMHFLLAIFRQIDIQFNSVLCILTAGKEVRFPGARKLTL
jgi:hypothetical protein